MPCWEMGGAEKRLLWLNESTEEEGKLAWRNWIARWTSNPAVVGWSATVSFLFVFAIILVSGIM